MKALRALAACLLLASCGGPSAQQQADEFLNIHENILAPLYAITSEAYWQSMTDVNEAHVGERIGAERSMAAFDGNVWVIETARALLARKDRLDPVTVRQIEKILLAAAQYPGTIPEIVSARVAAEARQGAVLDSFAFCSDRAGERCRKTVTANEIDNILVNSRDEAERRHIWEVSKQTGPRAQRGTCRVARPAQPTRARDGLRLVFRLASRRLRHDRRRNDGHDGALQRRFKAPLQASSHLDEASARRALRPAAYRRRLPAIGSATAGRKPGPAFPPAWTSTRWSRTKPPSGSSSRPRRSTPRWALPPLPASFYAKSDLYPVAADSERKKNTHASAWHMDLGMDVRSLMSVESNWRWFETSHHELGHIYYYLAYTGADVPLTLRGGANRAFHEAVGDLIGIAARRPAYLKEIGLLDDAAQIDEIAWLLDEALDQAVVFIPFSAGTMSFFEHDLYEKNIPIDAFNKTWWEYAGRYQGIEPPAERGEEFCDACTKTHISDDPAQYYDYAMAFVIKYQLHTYIARNILGQDPRDCNYYGNEEVGAFLWELLSLGATRDWREVIKEKTGEEISTRAMLDYSSR